MKVLPTLGLLALTVSPATSQSFSAERFYNSSLATGGNFQGHNGQLVDMDADGDVDLVLAPTNEGGVTWVMNEGAGRFSFMRTITRSQAFANIEWVAAGDLDGDGDVDVVGTDETFTSNPGRPVMVLRNLGGEEFAGVEVLSTLGGGSRPRLVDLDQDGDLDILFVWTTANFGQRIGRYVNDGTGHFGALAFASPSGLSVRDYEVKDLDSDGFPDIVWAQNLPSRSLQFARNRGTGTFEPPVTVATFPSTLGDLVVTDFNSDGLQDLLFAVGTPSELTWTPGLGSGAFAASMALGASPNSAALELGAADYDGDGLADVLAIDGGGSGARLYRQTASGGLAPPELLEAVPNGAASVIQGDVDQDGRPDLVVVGRGDTVQFRGAEGGAPPEQSTVTRTVSGEPVDFDQDGDIDFLGADPFAGEILLWRNIGDGTLDDRAVVLDGLVEPAFVAVHDANADGEQDLIVGSGFPGNQTCEVTLHLGSSGAYGPGQVIATNANASAASFIVKDMDSDGDLDVGVVYSRGSGFVLSAVQLLRYDGASGFSVGAIRSLFLTSASPKELQAVDVNGDGAVDFALRSSGAGGGLYWYRARADGSFNPAVTWSTLDVDAFTAADFDGDLDQDVIVLTDPFGETPRIQWNEGGGQLSAPQALPDVALIGPVKLASIDVDLDGQVDPIVIGSREAAWVRNLGGGNFGTPITFDTFFVPELSVGLDMDGDTDLDFVQYGDFRGPSVQFNDHRFGTGYCLAEVPNSTGSLSRIAAAGSSEVLVNDVTLWASALPPDSFGYFLVGDAASSVPMPGGSQGTLCIGGSVGRLNRGPAEIFQADAAGGASVILDLTDIPTPTGSIALLPGDTRYFQVWHRDANPAATSNFSNGLRIEFR